MSEQKTWNVRIRGDIDVIVPADLNNPTTYMLLEHEDWPEPELRFLRRVLAPGMTALDVATGLGLFALAAGKALRGRGKVIALNAEASFARSVEANGLQAVVARTDDGSPLDFLHLGNAPVRAPLLSRGSPLVLYRSSNERNALLQRQGMRLYRLMPGLEALVPVRNPAAHPGNLFAARPDRAEGLAERGLLLTTFGEAEDGADVTPSTQWQEALASAPYAVPQLAIWRALEIDADYETALNAYLSAQDTGLTAFVRRGLLYLCRDRWVALRQRGDADVSTTFGLIRVLTDLGQAQQAVALAEALVKRMDQGERLHVERPFLPPLAAFDQRQLIDSLGQWLAAAMRETVVMLRARTSYRHPEAQEPLLLQLQGLPDHSIAIERRLALCALRKGKPVDQGLHSRLLSDGHLNAALWAVLIGTSADAARPATASARATAALFNRPGTSALAPSEMAAATAAPALLVDVHDLPRFAHVDPTGVALLLVTQDLAKGHAAARSLRDKAGMACRTILLHDTLGQGFGKAIEAASARVDARYLACLTDDAALANGWLRQAVARLETDGLGMLTLAEDAAGSEAPPWVLLRGGWIKLLGQIGGRGTDTATGGAVRPSDDEALLRLARANTSGARTVSTP